MIYLHLFETQQEHDAAYSRDSEGYKEPWVAYTKETESVSYNLPQEHDYSKDYLTFKALEDGTFSFSKSGASYSLDGGDTWVELPANTNTPTINNGEHILFKGMVSTSSYLGSGNFSSTGRFEAMGNPLSLIYDNFSSVIDIHDKKKILGSMFSHCTNLISALHLALPATILSDNCYQGMFLMCTQLTEAPELPATTLTQSCYLNMFEKCSSLTTVPKLPATTLAGSCYSSMFADCTSLTTPPELPASTLTQNCYKGMFSGCTSLTTSPVLSAATLANYCYSYMFKGCASLETPPALPATTLAIYCGNYIPVVLPNKYR